MSSSSGPAPELDAVLLGEVPLDQRCRAENVAEREHRGGGEARSRHREERPVAHRAPEVVVHAEVDLTYAQKTVVFLFFSACANSVEFNKH